MNYHEYRCATCKKLLFKGILVESEVEVKCRGCGALNVYRGVSVNSLICLKENCAGRVRQTEDAPRE